jgi:transposase
MALVEPTVDGTGCFQIGGPLIAITGNQPMSRPSYHPSVLLKLYIYGYLNRVQSSHRLEREAGRNVEVMWLKGRLAPDHKTIADFRKDNGRAIRKVCARFIDLCREVGLLTTASVAIDGGKFKAVNNRGKVERRRAQLEESVARYLSQLDTADRHEPSEALARKTERLKEKLAKLKEEMAKLATVEALMLASPDQQVSLTDPDSRSIATRRPRLRCGGLQCSGRRRHRTSPDHYPRGDQRQTFKGVSSERRRRPLETAGRWIL